MIELPLVRQSELWDCALGCAESVLRFCGWSLPDAREQARRLAATPADGADPRTVEGFYRSAGLRVLSGDMAWRHLAQAGKAGIPVQILVNFGVGHYVVSEGVTRNRVRLMDPLDGRYWLKRDQFEKHWFDRDCRFNVDYRHFGMEIFPIVKS